MAERVAILAQRLAGILKLGLERERGWRFGPPPLVREEQQPKNGDGSEKVGDHDRAGIGRGKVAGHDNIADMAEPRADEEACGGDGDCEASPSPRLATPTSYWNGLDAQPIEAADCSAKNTWPINAQSPSSPSGNRNR